MSTHYWKLMTQPITLLNASNSISSGRISARFVSDPKRRTRFEIANELWRTMEGTTAQEI
jgi:hypothetical protein